MKLKLKCSCCWSSGGVDQQIHQKLTIYYAKIVKTSGWYQLNLIDIAMQAQNPGEEAVSLGADASAWTAGTLSCHINL